MAVSKRAAGRWCRPLRSPLWRTTPSKHIARRSQHMVTITQLGAGICTPTVRETMSKRRPQRVWCTRHGGVQTRCWPMVPAPTVAIVVYNPLQTHSSTRTTHGNHFTTWSRNMHSSCARNDVATMAPARLMYAACRFPNALLADGTGSYGRHSGVQPPTNT